MFLWRHDKTWIRILNNYNNSIVSNSSMKTWKGSNNNYDDLNVSDDDMTNYNAMTTMFLQVMNSLKILNDMFSHYIRLLYTQNIKQIQISTFQTMCSWKPYLTVSFFCVIISNNLSVCFLYIKSSLCNQFMFALVYLYVLNNLKIQQKLLS